MTARRHRKLGAHAFTLVELMIVVAIVSILAVLAIVAYRKFVLSAHTSEATHMVQSIRVAQQTYHAETQNYVSTSADGLHGLYPLQNDPPGSWKSPWTTPVGACPAAQQVPACFALLPLHADGAVMYGYATVAGVASTTPITISLPGHPALNAPAGPSPTDWFWVVASGNTTGAAAANWSYVVANSFSSDLFVQDQ